ncbi:hypothetical protein Lfu02_17710 [Longispora fulva]|uniref:Uncharacterized protein n=1 Tax=Longispora fulva TaxID=619741 RepID=A0A8J7KM99_9ACTN|nr:hypothetical protein [Longispora fulva]GIG57399.1 hypothetical protein Lfu02_17710 [Longispora fulva]
MEGTFTHDAHTLPVEKFRTWRLVKLTHRLPHELDDVAACELDWLLAIDDTVNQAKANRQQRESG